MEKIMWLLDILQTNIETSLTDDDKKLVLALEIPSEALLLEHLGDGKGIPTTTSDSKLQTAIIEFFQSGEFIFLFDLGLPYETSEDMDFADEVSSAISNGEKSTLLGNWDTSVNSRTVTTVWKLPNWLKQFDSGINDFQPLMEVLKYWHINHAS